MVQYIVRKIQSYDFYSDLIGRSVTNLNYILHSRNGLYDLDMKQLMSCKKSLLFTPADYTKYINIVNIVNLSYAMYFIIIIICSYKYSNTINQI